MDFITHLPKVSDFEAILVIIDRFLKYATFIPTTKQCSAEMTAQLFFKHVVKLWGVQTSIVSDRDGKNPQALNFTKEWKQTNHIARAYLEKASKRMKKWADKKRRPLEFRAGDQYEGPVKVLKNVGNTSYRVALPIWMKIYPVIHVSNLKLYHQDTEDLQQNIVTRPIIDLSQKKDKDVEEILVERVRRGRRPTQRIHEYLVKWKNLYVEETSWERVEDLEAWKQKIEDFKLRQLTGTSTI
ncbi:reverse transcriptase [Cucumis melo var. makuwa]|uniref:Reverse transcriptase n=1 Tax=Cucumis melo var. makuwa TaxID=1194695 RepID=A0A5D3DEJ9_CUCMM|nr:reverse transcriptase [Cucumis melo var. makuwa]TYK22014.1 reverse transcriptase [Cucumis melo var. makuwa]